MKKKIYFLYSILTRTTTLKSCKKILMLSMEISKFQFYEYVIENIDKRSMLINVSEKNYKNTKFKEII